MDENSALSETAPDQLYQVADLDVFPASDNLTLAYAKNSQTARLLPAEISQLLMQCREFKTLDEHVQASSREEPLSAAAMHIMRRELQRLAQNGYLIPQSRVRQTFQGLNEQSCSTSFAALGFPTADRVETLERGLTSYIECSQRFARNHEFVVMDDSAASETRNAYRQMLRSLKERYAVTLAYAGFEEKTAFVRKLAEMGDLPVDIVSFACIGNKDYGLTTVGANRNALLLHTTGDLIFSSDDDMICQLAASPRLIDGLALSSKGTPAETWFFPDRESILQSVHFVERDILALHEQWLGKHQEAWNAANGPGAPSPA